MNILMMTNTYLPHVGGVARSIDRFAQRYRHLGHQVKIVAPEFDNISDTETDVVRIPAIRNFNHTDFSVALPIPHNLSSALADFQPDIVHSHHPFLVGGTALRVAHTLAVPLVFTHHTKYEDYTHNVPGDSALLKRFVQKIATNYANTCDQVFVPSESIEKVLRKRGVMSPVSVVPTGVDLSDFASGNGVACRVRLGIPEGAFVVGHLGRISAEKNLPFLAQSVIAFLRKSNPSLDACFALFGSGPVVEDVVQRFASEGLSNRLFLGGTVGGQQLVDAYHAMDVFAFASKTETQGMVITEAMASGLPVVALDASGVREVIRNEYNGRLLLHEDVEEFSEAIEWIANLPEQARQGLQSNALLTANRFSIEKTADTALRLYSKLQSNSVAHRNADYSGWVDAMNIFESEWQILKNTLSAAVDTLTE